MTRAVVFDLEERTARFGEDIIQFVKTFDIDVINRILIDQLVRSGMSVGANYMEANGAESRKDFQHKIGICKKEVRETKHWLRMIAKANPQKIEQARQLWLEAEELVRIFAKIIITSKERQNRDDFA